MGWRNWPYWLKGGIFGGLIGIVWVISNLIYWNFGVGEGGSLNWIDYTFGSISDLLDFSLGFFVLPILLFFEKFSDLTDTHALIISVICLFLLGAIIGWIIGKIKSRNKTIFQKQIPK